MAANVCRWTMIAFFAVTGPASAQTRLEWQFVKGQVLEAERIVSQVQTVEIKGKEFKQERRSTWQVRVEVEGREGDGFQVSATLNRVEHKVAGAGATEIIDPKLHEKMQGSKFTMVVNARGQVRSLKGYDDMLKKMAAGNKERLKALQITFPEELLAEHFADLFGPLPEKPVSRGDTWQRGAAEPIPHFGMLRSTFRYTYDGKAAGLERISYAIQTTYEVPKDDKMVLFRLVKGDIKAEKGQGKIVLDNEAGHLLEHDRSMLLRGTLTIESMDRQETLTFTSANEVKIRIKPAK